MILKLNIAVLGLVCASLSAQNMGADKTLHELDDLLIQKNLDLIALKYNVQMADAQKVQAKLFDNPTINTEWSVWNPKYKFFHMRRNDKARPYEGAPDEGQFAISIQQSIKWLGKRQSAVNLAESQRNMSLAQYEMVAKDLKYLLHQSFYTAYFKQQALEKADKHLSGVVKIIAAYQEQYKKGNITLKELMRLKTLYTNLNHDIIELKADVHEEKAKIKTLLISPESINPKPNAQELLIEKTSKLNLAKALQAAEEQNPDLKLADATIDMNQKQLIVQKKQNLPDITLGYNYDKNGSYTPHYNAITVGASIPIFNRNQGNIKLAEYQIEQSKALKNKAENQIKMNIEKAFDLLQIYENEIGVLDLKLEQEFDLLMTNLNENYMKRNISLIEFTDLIESYQQNILVVNQLYLQHKLALEDFYYATGYAKF
jgi:outer membrane protein, heavy metal efflux system